jgi:hypothetical protein
MKQTLRALRLLGGLIFSWVIAISQPAGAATLVWTNIAGGDWNNATNWSPNQVPGGTDSAWITNSGTYTVGLQNYYGNAISNLVVGGVNGTQTFSMTFTLTINGTIAVNANGMMSDYLGAFNGYEAFGTLAGNGTLTANGQLTWEGSFNIPFVTNSGVANLVEGQMVGCEFVNSGQLTLTSYYNFNGGSLLTNTPTGMITSTILPNSDPYWTPAFVGTGGSVVANAGLLVLSYPGDSISSSFPTTVAPWVGYSTLPFINTGTLLITNSSFFSLNGGGTNYGNIIIDSGSTLICSNNYSFAPGIVLGGGTLLNEFAGFNLSGTIACGNFRNDQNKTTFVTGALNATNSTFDAATIFTNNGSLQGSILVRFGSLTCMGNGLLQPNAINLQANIYGTNPIVATGPLTWTGITGNIYDSVSVNGGTVNVPASTSIGSGGVLINTGTMNWTPNSGPRTGNGAAISNAPSGVINAVFNGNSFDNYVYGGGMNFFNAGQMNLSGTNQTGSFTCPFFNTGTVNINSGSLSLAGGGNNSNIINVAGGADLDFSGGSYTCTGTSLLAGAGNLSDSGNGTYNLAGAINVNGTWNFSGGTLNLLGSSSAAGNILNISGSTVNFNGPGPWLMGAVNLSNGTLGGSTPVMAGGQLTWTGGNIYGNLSANGGSINVPVSSWLGNGGELINTGNLTWTPNSGPRTGGGTVISNAPSGVISVALNGNNIESYAYGGATAFYNAGTINVAGAGQSGVITDPFYNTGTLNISSGTLSLTDGGTENGPFTVASLATLNLGGGTFIFNSGATISGAGSFASGATANLGSDLQLLGAGTFTVSGGNLTVGGSLGLGGDWTFSGGTATLTGSTTVSGNNLFVTGNGTVNFNGTGKGGTWQPGTVNLSNGTLGGSTPVMAGGQLTWTGGNIYGNLSANGGSINVPVSSWLGNGGELINTGNLTWTPNSGPRTGGGTVISNAPSGVISVALNGNNIESYAYGGATAFYNAGTINVAGAGQSGFITDPFYNTGTLNISSGTLGLNDGVSLTNGTFNFGISNKTSFGSVAIAGPVGLTGALGVTFNGYTPLVGDSFGLISYGSEAGTFTSFNLPATVGWQPSYGSTLFALTINNFVAAPTNVVLQVANPSFSAKGFNLLVSGPVGSNYVVQVTTNLFPPNWQPLTNFISTIVSSSVTDTNATKSQAARFYRAYTH